MNDLLNINGRKIGSGYPPYIIAEMSANHNGDINNAYKIIDMAQSSGADCVKLQTYTPDTLTIDSKLPDFQLTEGLWAGQSLYELYECAFMPWEWHKPLFDYAKKVGITIFSSPFDNTAVDLLEDLNVIAYKIASPEITDIQLLKKVAQTGKPVIVSTGLAEISDIELAVNTLREYGCRDVVLLKCTCSYPAPVEEINLRTIPDMAERFDCLTGLSDHSLGIGVPVAAVSLGARVIEKHFMLSKSNDSVDGFFSLDAQEFKQMTKEIRKIEKALGQIDYSISQGSKKNIFAKRSLYISKNIEKGELITEENIKSIRPSYGLHPKEWDLVIGKKAKKFLEKGDRLSWDLID